MADKQYYVKVNFEYGVDNGDGNFTMKNEGGASTTTHQVFVSSGGGGGYITSA